MSSRSSGRRRPKSDLAVELALRLDGEAVNADSMQLYRGMDIGTAKLSAAEMRGVPHHLLDVWDVTRTASVAEYQRLSADAIADVRGRGRLPVLVGGSGLYVRAALDHLEFPGTDPAVRARLEEELARVGPGVLHERLRGLDPAAADAILPSNGRRIVRPWRSSRSPVVPATLPEHRYRYDSVLQIGLSVPREVLDERIALRVERMWDAGLVDEVRDLEARPAGRPDRRARPRLRAGAPVPRGEWTQEQAKEDTIRTTRRFARRQESWFRRDPRVQWLPYDALDLVERALALITEEPGRDA